MTTAVCKFPEIVRRSMPSDPPNAFLFSICFKIILLQKNMIRLKICQNLVPLPQRISEYAADLKTYFKGLFTSFWGLTSSYLFNIQPNSKFHPPSPKFFGSAPECGIEFFFRTLPFEKSWMRPWACITISIMSFIGLLFCQQVPAM